MLIVQKLHVVVSMLSKVSYGQVGGSFPPEANVITLMGLTGHYWSSYCPVLVYYWWSGWDNNHSYFGIYYSNSATVNTAASKQNTIISGVKFKNQKTEYCSKNQVFTVNIKTPNNRVFAISSRFEKMKISVWFCRILLGILVGILVLIQQSLGSLAMLTLEDIKNKLKSAGGPGNHGLGQKISSKTS